MVSQEGDPPRSGLSNRLYFIGQRTCPECREDLVVGGNSCLVCVGCGADYQVGRVP